MVFKTLYGLGFLQVEEKHFNKGYGTLLAIETTKLFASYGYDVTSKIYTNNLKSIRLFEKLGFKKYDNVYWILPEITKKFFMLVLRLTQNLIGFGFYGLSQSKNANINFDITL